MKISKPNFNQNEIAEQRDDENSKNHEGNLLFKISKPQIAPKNDSLNQWKFYFYNLYII